MFLPCPHCGYHVALILPAPAGAPSGAALHCPRCNATLPAEPAAGELPAPGIAVRKGPEDAAQSRGASPAAEELKLQADDATPQDADAAIAAQTPSSAIDRPGSAAASPDAETTERAQPGPAPRTARAANTPNFVRASPARKSLRRRWPWFAAIAVLVALLALQLVLAQRAELAGSARWRPLVLGLCGVLRCTVPAWHEPAAFTMLARNVQPSATLTGALTVTARFRNDARWPQPLPALVVSLSDVEGRPVGMRAFTPAEYRHQRAASHAIDDNRAPDRRLDVLAPGQTATARLQVREPAPAVVAFTFDFR